MTNWNPRREGPDIIAFLLKTLIQHGNWGAANWDQGPSVEIDICIL